MRRIAILLAVIAALLAMALPAYAQVDLSPGEEGEAPTGELPETDVQPRVDVPDRPAVTQPSRSLAGGRAAADAGDDQLAATGLELTDGLLIGGVLVLAGGGLLLATRRRRGADA